MGVGAVTNTSLQFQNNFIPALHSAALAQKTIWMQEMTLGHEGFGNIKLMSTQH